MTNFSKVYKLATVLVVCGSSMFLIVLGQIAMWTREREPPFELQSYTAEPTQRGEVAVIYAKVHRDLSRMCSTTYSRTFIDSSNVPWDLTEGVRLMTANALYELDRRSPNSLTIKVRIPAGASVGKGSVMTVLEYVCNPVHQLYPIPLVLITNVEVFS